ncbi:MAG TPA: MerR family transcriptional regulator [Spirillospora sp.]
MDGPWTIAELAERAAAALTADGSPQVSGRVRDIPNERLIRWYTTIGLVDPPLGRRGRTAVYGRRHLLQLVAVKRRQAAGRSIAEIQLELAGATDATLERIAALPSSAAPPPHSPSGDNGDQGVHRGHADHGERRSTSSRRRQSVSASGSRPSAATSAPAHGDATDPEAEKDADAAETDPAGDDATDPADAPAGEASAAPAGGRGADEKSASDRHFWRTRPDIAFSTTAVVDGYRETRPRATLVQGVRLTPGLTLLLDAPALSGDDLAAIEAAARPLLDELRRRGLLTPAPDPAFPSPDASRRFS